MNPNAKALSFCLTLSLLLAYIMAGCTRAWLPAAAPADPLEMAPEEVVEAFYNWALEFPGNPSVEGAYRESPFLSQGLIERMQARLAERDPSLNFDPFLLAQAVPERFSVEAVSQTAQAARVVLTEDFGRGGVKDLTLDLVREAGEWKIDRIREGNPLTPEGVVALFYNAYLQSAAEGDGALDPDSSYLSPDFLKKHEESQAVSLDPFTATAATPDGLFAYQAVITSQLASVLVEFFWMVPDEPVHSEMRQVQLVKIGRLWQISGVEIPNYDAISLDAGLKEPLERWQTYVSDRYGFEFRYPPGWVLYQDEHNPYLSLLLMPPDVAADYLDRQERGALPDRTRPPQVPPFILSLHTGTRQEFDQGYPADGKDEAVNFNGIQAKVRRMPNGRTFIYFQHPYQPEVWIVFTDQVSQEPRHAAQAKTVQGGLEQILNSLRFLR